MVDEPKELSLNDEPSLKNSFNDDFLERLCPIIENCTPPKGMAITGYWGAGKTSSLKQLFFHLSGEAPPGYTKKDISALERISTSKLLVPVWFEAWRFQHEPQPIVALLNEIRVKMGLFQKLTKQGEKIGGVAMLGSLSVFDELIKMASGATVPNTSQIMAIGEKWETDRYMHQLPGEKMGEFLEEAIDNALGNSRKNKKLVIFIDDLDRCLPTSALRLLEGIKIYLNIKNSIVIFGMDHRQLQQSLLQALPLNDKQQESYYAQEYLEKICPDIHYLPIPSKDEKCKYFIDLLKRLDIGDEQKKGQHIKFLKIIFGAFDILPANPRKIKMLVNRTALVLRAVGPEHVVDKPYDDFKREYSIILGVNILYTFHKAVYEQLENKPAYINEVINYSTSDAEQLVDDRFFPMRDIIPSRVSGDGKNLPVNPSDSNVFRLHELFDYLGAVIEVEITPYLRLRR